LGFFIVFFMPHSSSSLKGTNSNWKESFHS